MYLTLKIRLRRCTNPENLADCDPQISHYFKKIILGYLIFLKTAPQNEGQLRGSCPSVETALLAVFLSLPLILETLL